MGAVCGFADITAQKALMRELELRRREAEEAAVRKTRFLASVSHDIRTPANAINLMAEVIKRTASTPDFASQIPALAGKLQANALSLVELVSDVLDLARYDTGKIELQESEFALAEVLNAEVVQLMPLAQEKGLALTVEPLAQADLAAHRRGEARTRARQPDRQRDQVHRRRNDHASPPGWRRIAASGSASATPASACPSTSCRASSTSSRS